MFPERSDEVPFLPAFPGQCSMRRQNSDCHNCEFSSVNLQVHLKLYSRQRDRYLAESRGVVSSSASCSIRFIF